MVVFTVIFGRLANLPSNGAPYPVLVFAALVPWQFFSNALMHASVSLIDNAQMISKVYFPRLALPGAAVIVAVADFAIAFCVLLVLMLVTGVGPTVRLLAIPVFLVLAGMAALGAGIWISAFNVRYRDFRYVVPFVLQLRLYASPVGFSSSIVPAQWQLAVLAQPDGRGHRRFPVGDPARRPRPSTCPASRSRPSSVVPRPRVRPVVLPPDPERERWPTSSLSTMPRCTLHGRPFNRRARRPVDAGHRGCEGLGKAYLIRHQTRTPVRGAARRARRRGARRWVAEQPARSSGARLRRSHRVRRSGRCATSRSRFRAARWSASSAGTAPARAPCSRS